MLRFNRAWRAAFSIVLVGIGSLTFPPPSARPTAAMAPTAATLPCTVQVRDHGPDIGSPACEPITRTIQLATGCERPLVHVVLAYPEKTHEPSWTMDRMAETVEALWASPFDVRIGVVRYRPDGASETLVPLTTDATLISDAIKGARRGASERPDLHTVATEVTDVLIDDSPDRKVHPTANKVVVLFATLTKPHQVRVHQRAFDGARLIHTTGAELIVACPSTNHRTFCTTTLRDMVKRPSLYTQAPELKLAGIVTSLLPDPTSLPRPAELLLEADIPSLVELDPAASLPPPHSLVPSPAGGRATWRWTAPAAALPITLTLVADTRALGADPITGRLLLTDTLGIGHEQPFTTAPITVTELCVPSTATPTVTPLPTASATPTTPPTATPTPRPAPIYLPLALREPACTPDWQRVDVALVLDASTSMDELTAAGRPKLAAARDAARAFLSALRLDTGDQAAIVTFNAEAMLLQTLTSSEPDLHAALDRIATAPQTRIHRGIEVAAAELASPRRATGHTPVLVLLTDGRANPEGPEFAVAEADAAKRAGVTVFTVGLGDDLDHEALRAMASRPEDYHHAPDAEQLAEIYRAIAVAIPCPVERFWGRR